MKKFLKNLLRDCWWNFEIISQECFLGEKNRSKNFDSSVNMALVNWGFMHYTALVDEGYLHYIDKFKKFLKNLL